MPYAAGMDGEIDLGPTFATLLAGASMGAEEAERVFAALLEGSLGEARIGALLALLQAKGVDADELAGAARVMRRHVTPVPFRAEAGEALIDTCGTGGAPKTFNVSTASAIVAAAADAGSAVARVVVAKHGNRSRTGRGSAEVLARLGVNVDATPEVQARCLRETGACFCFAIHHHPAMRHAAGPRRALGFPTIFNLLGPLTNPAGATHQLIGVYDPDLARVVARALARLGTARAMVVHGDGLDELTVTGPTRVLHVGDGAVTEETVEPESLGLGRAGLDELRVDTVDAAAEAIRAVLDGAPGAKRDMVVLNAAGALVVAGAAPELAAGVAQARDAIDSGRARGVLERLASVSQGAG